MTAPMGALAGACVFIGLGSPLVAPVLDRVVSGWAPDLGLTPTIRLAPLTTVTALGGGLLITTLALGASLAVRTRRAAAPVGTWDCGYAAPSVRMQYTSSSFAQALVGMCRMALRPHVHRRGVPALFPDDGSFESHVPDVVLDELLTPGVRATARGLGWFRWLQRGSLHAYLVYILATLVWLLVWQRGR
jgi:hypothetical protein